MRYKQQFYQEGPHLKEVVLQLFTEKTDSRVSTVGTLTRPQAGQLRNSGSFLGRVVQKPTKCRRFFFELKWGGA
jgi:hypothetical protein